MASFSREDYIYYARLAEQGERYEDMIRYMKEVSRVSDRVTSRRGLCWSSLLHIKRMKYLTFTYV